MNPQQRNRNLATVRKRRERITRSQHFDWDQTIVLVRGSILLLAAAFVVLMLLLPSKATFTVNAHTNALTLRINAGDHYPSWGAPSTVATVDYQTGRMSEWHCGTLDVSLVGPQRHSQAIEFTLLNETNPMPGGLVRTRDSAIAADFNSGSVRAAVLCDRKTVILSPPFRLTFRPTVSGIPLTIPFSAPMQVGGSAKFSAAPDPAPQPALLIEGVLTVEASSWPSQSGHARSEISLHAGDVLTFEDGNNGAVVSAGIIQTVAPPLDDPYLLVVARSSAKEAQVVSPLGLYTAQYAPSLWERLQAMGQWAALIALATLAFGLLDLTRDYMAIRRNKD